MDRKLMLFGLVAAMAALFGQSRASGCVADLKAGVETLTVPPFAKLVESKWREHNPSLSHLALVELVGQDELQEQLVSTGLIKRDEFLAGLKECNTFQEQLEAVEPSSLCLHDLSDESSEATELAAEWRELMGYYGACVLAQQSRV